MLIALNKPYLVHCKFTDQNVPPRPTLAQFGLPPRVYVAGRLDHDSEGLLLLTDDGKLNQRLTDPRWKAPKTYYVQVEGTPSEEALARLRAGVELNDGPTLPAEARGPGAKILCLISHHVPVPRAPVRAASGAELLYLSALDELPVRVWDYTSPERVHAAIDLGRRNAETLRDAVTRFLAEPAETGSSAAGAELGAAAASGSTGHCVPPRIHSRASVE